MSTWTSAAFGMPAMTPATGVVPARAPRQRAVACADHGYAKRAAGIATDAVRGDLTVDVPGVPAWSPPV
jgi:hypothetical protein